MAEAYIVSTSRTAGGRRGGQLSGWHPVDLGGRVVDDLLQRSGVDPSRIDDVIFGCVTQIGPQASNIARNVALASSLPESVPGTSIDRQCGSSQQAIHFAAQAVMSGSMDMVIAGGVESMSQAPMGSPVRLAVEQGLASPQSPAIQARYPGHKGFSQFVGAEMVARKYGLDRQTLETFALHSHQRAWSATEAGTFTGEILAVESRRADGAGDGQLHRRDEGIRANASLAHMATLETLSEGGVLTAATASQICDGAAGVLVVSERALKEHGLTPLARIVNMTVLGHDPVIMLEAPIPATALALKRAGLRLSDIDLYEVNEAFASIPLAWLQASEGDPDRLNIFGGAIALGHPLGASGAKLMTTLITALQVRRGRLGLLTMCEGGGMANVTIIERLG